MRTITTTIVVALVTTLSRPVGADTRCESIKDNDDRMICRATTTGLKSWCGFVKDPQKRAWCHVVAGR